MSIHVPVEWVLLNGPTPGKEMDDLIHTYMRFPRIKNDPIYKPFFSVEDTQVNTFGIIPTQHSVNLDGIQDICRELEMGSSMEKITLARFAQSSKLFIMDGHHRSCAWVISTGRIPIPASVYIFSERLVV